MMRIRPSAATIVENLLYLSDRVNRGLLLETIQECFIFVSDVMSRVAKQLYVTYKQDLPQTSASYLMLSTHKYTYRRNLCVPQAVQCGRSGTVCFVLCSLTPATLTK
jgi:hypothetical protein